MSTVFPSVRSDGVLFVNSRLVGDRLRAIWAAARRKLLLRLACIQHRGDWQWHKQVLCLHHFVAPLYHEGDTGKGKRNREYFWLYAVFGSP